MSPDKTMISRSNNASPTQILLCTLNSTYQHSAFGLRYLLANMGELKSVTQIYETTIDQKTEKICSAILEFEPQIIGFGVYIWNIDQTLALIKSLRQVSPELKIIVGGPEVSYEIENQEIRDWVDCVITGEADFTFRETCLKLLASADEIQKHEANAVWPNIKKAQIINSPLPAISQIITPYDLYTDEDIKNRLIYVEASRGCPYKCEYCLSSLDKSVRSFDLDSFLASLKILIERGARNFKFIDRTFNLNMTISQKIIGFFLEHIELGLFLHFEMVPDRLPEELRTLFKKFPAGSVQFEIGIQTLNVQVAKNISRNNDLKKVIENFKFLREETHIHTHADLIVGLPGESLESFGQGFDLLYSWKPDEIQVGLLKRLKGTPIARHEKSFSLLYSTKSPFTIISTKDISAEDVIRMGTFSRFWDHLFNHGEFPQTASLIESLGPSIFKTFLELSDWLFSEFGRAYAIRMENWIPVLAKYFELKGVSPEIYIERLAKDYYRKPNRNRLPLLEPFDFIRRSHQGPRSKAASLSKRQQSHLLT